MEAAAIYSKTGKPFRSDYDLIVACQDKNSKKAFNELWDKYFLLRQKKKYELRNIAARNGFDMSEELQNWEADAWEKFKMQMEGVDRTKIKNPDTWKIYIRLNGYWNSMNRDILHGKIKKFEKEVQDSVLRGNSSSEEYDTDRFYTYNENKDTKLYQTIFNKALQRTYSGLDKNQKKIFDMKSQKFSIKDISEKLHTSPDIVKLNLKAAKQTLSNNIENVSASEYGQKISYKDIVEGLS